MKKKDVKTTISEENNRSCKKENCTKTTSCKCKKCSCRGKDKTVAIIKCDIGWGNTLFIRGENKPLNWEKGKPLSYDEEKQGWIYENSTKKDLEFKVLINDEHWSEGENFVLHVGKTETFEPKFS